MSGVMRQGWVTSVAIAGALSLIGGAVADSQETSSPERRERLGDVQREIDRLERELAGLRKNERGVLSEIEELGVRLRLQATELKRVSLRHDTASRELSTLDARLTELVNAQAVRRRYLEFRVRELYKAGPDQVLRRFVGGEGVEEYWGGLRYAAFLSDRDLKVVRAFRETRGRLEADRARVASTRAKLGRVQVDLETKQRQIQEGRRARERKLTEIREDGERRREALAELQAAAEELSRVVDSFSADAGRLDVTKFRGLLDWPSAGEVDNGFGAMIHPRFRTTVPHPGLDIEGGFGADIVSVFDGEVRFAAWMRGYGLTAIVDHGGGLLSIYAHASVLLVEAGDRCRRGQVIGKIGDSGSLRGPYLYFELRVDGRPTDPVVWLRRR